MDNMPQPEADVIKTLQVLEDGNPLQETRKAALSALSKLQDLENFFGVGPAYELLSMIANVNDNYADEVITIPWMRDLAAAECITFDPKARDKAEANGVKYTLTGGTWTDDVDMDDDDQR